MLFLCKKVPVKNAASKTELHAYFFSCEYTALSVFFSQERTFLYRSTQKDTIEHIRGETVGVIKEEYSCMLALAMDLVGGKWKMAVLWQLRERPVRFGELKRRLAGVTQKMLTQQLRELEELGLVTRTVHMVVPPKVEYSLAPEGEKLVPVLSALCQWSGEYAAAHAIGKMPACPLSRPA
jgi:DNA-binding HxlR family transcriptional regulator